MHSQKIFKSGLIVPALLLSVLVFTGCGNKKKDEVVSPGPGPVVEQELITTMILHFQSTGGAEQLEFNFRDLDGDGGNAPVIEVEDLSPDTTYLVHVELLNESVSPVEVITEEVEAEGDHHQFFYLVDGANVAIAYDDEDEDGLPIGLRTIWTVGATSSGTVTVVLRHDLDKNAAGVSNGDISNAGGDTDIQVVFAVVIQ